MAGTRNYMCSNSSFLNCIENKNSSFSECALHYSYSLSYCLSKYWSFWIWKELKRLVAYAGSSANLLTKLILEDQSDSYRWEVSLTNLSVIMNLLVAFFWYITSYWSVLIGLQCLFRTPLNNYDAVILLHREKLPYPQRLLFPSELHQGRFSMVPSVYVPMGLLFSPLFLTMHMLILGRGACGTWECKQEFPPLSFAWRF